MRAVKFLDTDIPRARQKKKLSDESCVSSSLKVPGDCWTGPGTACCIVTKFSFWDVHVGVNYLSILKLTFFTPNSACIVTRTAAGAAPGTAPETAAVDPAAVLVTRTCDINHSGSCDLSCE